jgi:hypothetical protein
VPEDRFCGSYGAALMATRARPRGDSQPATDTGWAEDGTAGRGRTGHDRLPDQGGGRARRPAPGFFVSYADEDLARVEWIGWHLEEATVRVALQRWDSVAGQNWVAGLDDGGLLKFTIGGT